MTRRETLGLLCGVPFAVMAPHFGGHVTRRQSAALHWDWTRAELGPVEHFEVSVLTESSIDDPRPSFVTSVPGHARSCEIPLPTAGAVRLRVEVRAVNAQGVSEPCSQIIAIT